MVKYDGNMRNISSDDSRMVRYFLVGSVSPESESVCVCFRAVKSGWSAVGPFREHKLGLHRSDTILFVDTFMIGVVWLFILT